MSRFSVEAKRFVLIFPEGKGLLGGWLVLAQKLRSCEAKSQLEQSMALLVQMKHSMGTTKDASLIKEAGVPQGSKVDLVWLQIEDVNAFNKLHHLSWCLVGSW